MQSYPTPESSIRYEHLRHGFSKAFIPESGRPFHIFTEPDTGWAHDHNFSMISHVVAGGYVEEVFTIHPDGTATSEVLERLPGTSHHIKASTIHRVLSLPAGFCVTHVEPGPPEQDWSFFRFDDAGVWRRGQGQNEFELIAPRLLP